MSGDGQKAVYILHGIRDFAGWTTPFKSVFETNGISAESRYLGWIGLWPFVVPGQVYADHRDDILSDLKRYKGKELTIVAHSFGTWLITRLLREEKQIKVKRIILCNGVVANDFPWNELKNVEEKVTVCGNNDVWPCAAEIISSRFGAIGTRGAQCPGVIDTYFNMGHSGALTEDFCRTHLLPMVLNGTKIKSEENDQSPAVRTLRYLNENRILVVVGVMLAFLSFWYAPTWLSCSVSQCFVDIVRTEDFRDVAKGNGPRSYVRDVTQSYSFNYDEKLIELTIRTDPCERPEKSGKVDVAASNEVVNIFVYDLLSKPGTRMGYKGPIDCIRTYEVPVVNRKALVRVRFASSNAVPEGSVISIPRVVRNLTLEIILSPGDRLRPLSTKIREGVQRSVGRFVGRAATTAVAEDPALDGCAPNANDEKPEVFGMVCNNIWLMPPGKYLTFFPFALVHEGERLLFCFTISGWFAPAKEGGECPFRVAPPL